MEGVTDGDKPRRLGPKRANYIRKVFALRNNKKEGKVDDVRKYVVRREIKKGDKTFYKSPKIQRLITEKRIRRKKLYKREKLAAFKLSKDKKAKYEKVLSQFIKERKAIHLKKDEGKTEAPKAEEKKAQPGAKKVKEATAVKQPAAGKAAP